MQAAIISCLAYAGRPLVAHENFGWAGLAVNPFQRWEQGIFLNTQNGIRDAATAVLRVGRRVGIFFFNSYMN